MSKLATRHLLPLAGAAALLIGASLPAHAYKVYISNEKDNSISVIDSEKLEVVATWKVGRRPRGITCLLYTSPSPRDS